MPPPSELIMVGEQFRRQQSLLRSFRAQSRDCFSPRQKAKTVASCSLACLLDPQ
jgi:hypothetical protein